MSDNQDGKGAQAERGGRQQTREARLAQQLRANLMKRKVQARARQGGTEATRQSDHNGGADGAD